MSIKMSKDNLCINQIMGQKCEKVIVEGDEIVPDIKPDILSIINSNGTVCIYKKEIQDGKVKIDGNINMYVTYIADNENAEIKSLNINLDFSKSVEMRDIRANMQLDCRNELIETECRIINGRKISAKATIEFNLTAYSNENVEYIKEIEDSDDIQILTKKLNVNSLVGSASTKVYAKDTISIDGIDNLSEIIKVNVQVENKENKISYNKVLAKADTIVKVVYLTQDNRVNTASASISIMGFMDVQNITEENICDVNYQIRNLIVKPNSVEEHSIYVEAEFEISCMVYENKQINMIQDMYSRTKDLEYKMQNITIMQGKKTINEICNIRKQEQIQEIGQNKICDVDVKPMITNYTIDNGSISYQGNINLTFIYMSTNSSSMQAKTIIEPFEFVLTSNEVTSRSKIQTSVEVAKQEFLVMPDESIDMKIDLNFSVETTTENNINLIREVDEIENRAKEKYSVVIYYVKKGDTLWNIAKRFGSSVEEIVSVNCIEDEDKIMPGQQLFIPR